MWNKNGSAKTIRQVRRKTKKQGDEVRKEAKNCERKTDKLTGRENDTENSKMDRKRN